MSNEEKWVPTIYRWGKNGTGGPRPWVGGPSETRVFGGFAVLLFMDYGPEDSPHNSCEVAIFEGCTNTANGSFEYRVWNQPGSDFAGDWREANPIIEGRVKWDGCWNWSMHGCTHTCGPSMTRDLADAIVWAHERAEELGCKF